jgi:hypothetical protein
MSEELVIMNSYNERLLYYATAKRATAAQITQVIDGDFHTSWAGKLRGGFVSLGDEFRKPTKAEALDVARRYRKACIEEAMDKGLLSI